jgi:hypothetical protein
LSHDHGGRDDFITVKQTVLAPYGADPQALVSALALASVLVHGGNDDIRELVASGGIFQDIVIAPVVV